MKCNNDNGEVQQYNANYNKEDYFSKRTKAIFAIRAKASCTSSQNLKGQELLVGRLVERCTNATVTIIATLMLVTLISRVDIIIRGKVPGDHTLYRASAKTFRKC